MSEQDTTAVSIPNSPSGTENGSVQQRSPRVRCPSERPRWRAERRRLFKTNAGPSAARKPSQAERRQALQDLLRLGQPRAHRRDLQVSRRAAGRDKVPALLRRRNPLSAARKRARRGRLPGPAHLLSRRPAPDGTADHDGRAQARLRRPNHGRRSLLRLCAPGPQRPSPRGDHLQSWWRIC